MNALMPNSYKPGLSVRATDQESFRCFQDIFCYSKIATLDVYRNYFALVSNLIDLG